MRLKILVITLLSAFSVQLKAQNDLSADLQKLELFLSSIDGKYVDSVNTYNLVQTAIREMLRDLDPHSVYLDQENYSSSNEQLQGKFKGMGIRYQMIDDTMTVLEVMKGSGADKSGLKLGDQLIAAGNDTISGKLLSPAQIASILNDNAESNEGITVWRDAGKDRTLFQIQRSSIDLSSVPISVMLDKRIGYVKLTKFTSTSHDDFRNALQELNDEGVNQLIVDLRGNSGGYLSRAIKITDEFLDDRKLIVFTEGLHQAKKETYATSGGKYLKGDLILLIDENSASASEIFAGAIQDWDRGLIIGRRSFGKGLVQRPIEFNDGSAMRLTISRYYTPTGRSIQQPYDQGYEAYKKSHQYRDLSGELLNVDSIKVADSLIYYTPKKRKVYGGGGILPDVFVAKDTLTDSDFIDKLHKRGLIYGYALNYANSNKVMLVSRYERVNDFLLSVDAEVNHLNGLANYLNQRNFQFETSDLASNMPQIQKQLIPLICRFMYDYEAYLRAKLNYDPDVIAAINAFEKDTIQELGLK